MKIPIAVYATPTFGQHIAECLDACSDLEITGLAASRDELRLLVSKSNAPVVLLEAAPELSDPETIIDHLRNQHQYFKATFLILAHRLDFDQVQRGVHAGAAGYILVQPQLDNLPNSVRLVKTGKMALAPEITRLLA